MELSLQNMCDDIIGWWRETNFFLLLYTLNWNRISSEEFIEENGII